MGKNKIDYIKWAKQFDLVCRKALREGDPFFVKVFTELTEVKDGFVYLKTCYTNNQSYEKDKKTSNGMVRREH